MKVALTAKTERFVKIQESELEAAFQELSADSGPQEQERVNRLILMFGGSRQNFVTCRN